MKNFLIIFAIILGLAGVGYAAYALSSSSSNPSLSPSTSSQAAMSNNTTVSPSTPSGSSGSIITKAQLAQNNGKNGASCWVAVSGTVYDVTGSRGWSNGVHTQSNGEAKCGEDETAIINQAPHGTDALSQLPVVGKLQ